MALGCFLPVSLTASAATKPSTIKLAVDGKTVKGGAMIINGYAYVTLWQMRQFLPKEHYKIISHTKGYWILYAHREGMMFYQTPAWDINPGLNFNGALPINGTLPEIKHTNGVDYIPLKLMQNWLKLGYNYDHREKLITIDTSVYAITDGSVTGWPVLWYWSKFPEEKVLNQTFQEKHYEDIKTMYYKMLRQ